MKNLLCRWMGVLVLTLGLSVLGTARAATLSYVPGLDVEVVQTWTAVAGTDQWTDWTNWDSGNSVDAAGNKVLGNPTTGARGAIYLNKAYVTGSLPTMSYKDSGIALSFTRGTGASSIGSDVYLEMITFDNDFSNSDPTKRNGFIIAGFTDGTGARTVQQFADGNYRFENWADGTLSFEGEHTMALVLEDKGVAGKVDVVSYFDGVEKNRFEADDPLAPLARLGVGFEYTGNHYAKRGTLVSEVVAFTIIPEPSTLILLGAGLLGLIWRRRRRA